MLHRFVIGGVFGLHERSEPLVPSAHDESSIAVTSSPWGEGYDEGNSSIRRVPGAVGRFRRQFG